MKTTSGGTRFFQIHEPEPMNTQNRFSAAGTIPRGFALVVTLSLMILLTIVAVGLLSLSTISLRASSQESEMQLARNSAKLGLMLAINQLQMHAGPDQRITAPAEQIPKEPDGMEPLAPIPRQKWTASYDAWAATSTTRPTSPNFRQWLVSGIPENLANLGFLNDNSGNKVEIVGQGTVGTSDPADRVEVPLIEQSLGARGKSRLGWWVGDEGIKAYVPSEPTPAGGGSSDRRLALQAAPRYGLEVMGRGTDKAFADYDHESPDNRKLISWNQTAFAATPAKRQPLFHHLSTQNRGLVTNVRAGGFRKDLSIALQAPENAIPRTALYSVGGRAGINLAELWTHHNLWSQLRSNLGGNYSTGGAVPASAETLQAASTQAAFTADRFSFQKQPAFVRFQTILSFSSTPVTNPSTGLVTYSLGIVMDPVVTLWNPLDVPISMRGSWNSVKYWPIPYDIIVSANGVEHRVPYNFIVGRDGVPQNLTMRTGTDNLVLKPGEVMVFSQGSSTPTTYSAGQFQTISSKKGFNFGGGMFYEYKNNEGVRPNGPQKPPLITGQANTAFTYRVEPNNRSATGSQQWALNTHGIYYKEDRVHTARPRPDDSPGSSNETVFIGDCSIDSRGGQPYDSGGAKPDNLRIRASAPAYRDFFDRIGGGTQIRLNEINTASGNKRPFMIFTFAVKTEGGAENPGRYFARYNPRAGATDFFDIKQNELRTLPFEIQTRRLSSWLDPLIDVSKDGNGYFGGGWTSEDGAQTFISHSVPRQAPVSLAAFQHAMANGFMADANGRLNTRRFLLPQISHAIGNSLAPSVIPAEATEGELGGPRPLADHSYLANQALWDDWFLSGISPQTSKGFSASRNQRTVALDFLKNSKPLPVRQFKPSLNGQDAETAVGKWFNGSAIRPGAEALTASQLTVEGMFNVNSASTEAWKALLSALRGRELLTQNPNGTDASLSTGNTTAVASLHSPLNLEVTTNQLDDRTSPAQWAGVRTLDDGEIEELAVAIVREVRKRGPFLSLADFINRRPGSNKELALSGAIQSALDSNSVSINQAFRSGERAATGNPQGLAFTEAETGAAAYGIPGYVKQADILTPIAPLLSVRSDTFVIRAYGEKLDAGGRVTARAWCEATLQRGAGFVDPSDEITMLPAQLNKTNQSFGRRFDMVSFRWLSPSEV